MHRDAPGAAGHVEHPMRPGHPRERTIHQPHLGTVPRRIASLIRARRPLVVFDPAAIGGRGFLTRFKPLLHGRRNYVAHRRVATRNPGERCVTTTSALRPASDWCNHFGGWDAGVVQW
jgi:hypothetical protein